MEKQKEVRRGLVIAGMGGHALVVAAMAKALGLPVLGFLDALGEPQYQPAGFDGLPVLGGLSALEGDRLAALTGPCAGIAAMGDNRLRQSVLGKIRRTGLVEAITLVHPRSVLESGVQLGIGSMVCLSAILCAKVRVGEGVIINTGAIVDHECVLGDFCHISPGVRLAGRVQVGDFAHVGIGATVIDKLHIGRHAVIGAGAVVVDDIPDYATAVGIPARVIKVRQP